MKSEKKIILISNEKISFNNENYYCDNIDMKSIPEGLSNFFKILLIGRETKIKRSHQIKLNNVLIASNLFKYLSIILNTFKEKNVSYLLISITPYTFIGYLFLFFFRKKVFVYLRSNGYEEYKCYSKFFGPLVYHIMFTIVSFKANLISCREHILRKKNGKIVSPSQLNEKWFLPREEPDLSKINLLYVGRIKIEKGIFSLFEILKNTKIKFLMSFVISGKFENANIKNENIKVISFENKDDSIIKFYDSHNIFILPSFTEGHPQVLDESLSRLRPVIIFKEISHVIGQREGVFIAERNSSSLFKVINYIMNNYKLIQEKMSKNKLPTKESFLKELYLILR